MNRRVGHAIGSLGAVVGLLAAYYALPLVLAVISLGEICAYSPLGTNLWHIEQDRHAACPEDS
jgi:hypothetical protein